MNESDFPLFHYRAMVEHIVDGDTIQVLLDLGDRTYRTRRVRLLGYNAPEIVGQNRAAGIAARDALAEIIPPDSRVYIETYLDRESFDRLLGHVYAPGNGDELLDVAGAMIASGHGAKA
jgi:micrococcal nuclease